MDIDFDKKLEKLEQQFTDSADDVYNISKNRFKLLFNEGTFSCECQQTILYKDLENHHLDKFHKYYIKDQLKYLKERNYFYYIKRNKLMDKYFLEL